MQVMFPNPFGGGPLPSAQAVQDLQSQHGFSDALAQFYLRQNGFNSQAMDADPEAAQAFLRGGEADPPGAADLARLFALNADKAHMDLGAALASNLFAGLCFPIGKSFGGDLYVEILCGRYQGFIASLDHELYLGIPSLDEVLDELVLDVQGMSRDQVMDTLCDPDSDLVWFHARDMQQFLNDCVFWDENGNCFVRDAVNPSGELG